MNKSFDLEGTLILHEALASLSEIRVKLYEKFVTIVRGSEDLSIIGINSRNGSGQAVRKIVNVQVQQIWS